MKTRFEGQEGRRLLIEALLRQDLVQHDEVLAVALADSGELIEFQSNSEIVTQEGADNDVYFLLTGECNAFVNDRYVGTRADGTCIGEMAAIDSAAPRSATVRTKTDVVALKVSEPKFRAALDSRPQAYRFLGQLLADRLRQRSRYYKPPNPQPVLFIGCSAEAVPIANELQAGFKHDPISAIVWTNGVFGPGGITFDSLYQVANSVDFAAFVISPDDTVISRATEFYAPRDNVIFEMGLFMGRLDRERVFLVKHHDLDVKIPSDLLGITLSTYVLKSPVNLAASLGPVCTELRKAIGKLGVI